MMPKGFSRLTGIDSFRLGTSVNDAVLLGYNSRYFIRKTTSRAKEPGSSISS